MYHPGNKVTLGQIVGTNRKLVMTPKERSTHLWIPGNSGVGKSKLIESMICQDIDNWGSTKCGLLLIDPEGEVYKNVLKHVVEVGYKRPIIPIDFTRDDWIIGYNPLYPHAGADLSVIVDSILSAIGHAFHSTDPGYTARFTRIGSSVLYVLLESGRPFLEAYHLTVNQSAMGVFADRVKEHYFKTNLRRSSRQNDRDFQIEIESTLSRFMPFAVNQRFKAMFGHTGKTLNMRDVLEEGKIVLVNLSEENLRLSARDATIFGTMLLTDLWTATKSRPKPKDGSEPKPFYVYVDEVQNFITPDIAQNLVRARKRGVCLTVANQYPSQFLDDKEHGLGMFRALMNSARSKAVFQVTEQNDVPALTLALFRGMLDPMKVKQMTKAIVGYEWQEVVTETEASTDQEGGSEVENESSGRGKSQRFARADENDSDPPTYESEQEGRGGAKGTNWMNARTRATSTSKTLVPILGDQVGDYFPLDEQLSMFEKIIDGQDNRQGMARLSSMKTPVAIRTVDVKKAAVSEERLERYLNKLFTSLEYAVELGPAIAAAVKREEDFLRSVIGSPAGGDPSRAGRPVGASPVRRVKKVDATIVPPIPSEF